MEISHIKSISKILTDLCVTRQRVKKTILQVLFTMF